MGGIITIYQIAKIFLMFQMKLQEFLKKKKGGYIHFKNIIILNKIKFIFF